MRSSTSLLTKYRTKSNYLQSKSSSLSFSRIENILLSNTHASGSRVTIPSMALSTLYWRAWSVLLIVSSLNTETLGSASWDTYPTMRYLMEMVMTQNYEFPPPTQISDDVTADDIRARERQTAELEKQEILDFERHLAKAVKTTERTEHNSLLLPILIRLDPRFALHFRSLSMHAHVLLC